jgi:hypothetical protein
MEIAFLAKSLYLTFEYTLQEIEAKKKLKDRGELLAAYPQRILFPWFQSNENQVILFRNLHSLNELAIKPNLNWDLSGEER